MRSISRYFWFLGIFALVGCEGEFSGKRAENLEAVNGPFQMKVVTVGGASYLGILNTNYRFQTAGGSLQFYDIAAQPTLSSVVKPVSLPSNISDFLILNDVLYVLDRNEDELRVYDLSSGTFSPRMVEGEESRLRIASNPTQLLSYVRTSDSKQLLVVVAQSTGTMSQIDPETFTHVNPAAVVSGELDAGKISGSSIFGAKFYMKPRRTEDAEKDDELGVSGLRRLGIGITGAVLYGESEDIFIGFNAVGLAAYLYRFGTYKNTANFTWDLNDFVSDTDVSIGVSRVGTDEDGFRGIDKDDAGNLYLSNQTDNSLYKLGRAELLAAKTDDNRNTTGFKENIQRRRIEIDLDDNLLDETFPRLGALVVEKADYQTPNLLNNGTAANVAWVVALGLNSVIRVDLTTGALIKKEVGELPQRLLRSSGDLLLVSSAKGDRVNVLNATTLEQVGLIQNP